MLADVAPQIGYQSVGVSLGASQQMPQPIRAGMTGPDRPASRSSCAPNPRPVQHQRPSVTQRLAAGKPRRDTLENRPPACPRRSRRPGGPGTRVPRPRRGRSGAGDRSRAHPGLNVASGWGDESNISGADQPHNHLTRAEATTSLFNGVQHPKSMYTSLAAEPSVCTEPAHLAAPERCRSRCGRFAGRSVSARRNACRSGPHSAKC
jgi:hypothetical protein